MSSGDGSSRKTGEKRRSRAGSFSMCLRYSSSVVAPMTRSSPRDSAGFIIVLASMAPSAAPGADDLVQLVDEDDHLALGAADLVHDGLQPLLELAAELRAGDHRAHIEREQALVLDVLRHVAGDDLLREALRRRPSCRRRPRR